MHTNCTIIFFLGTLYRCNGGCILNVVRAHIAQGYIAAQLEGRVLLIVVPGAVRSDARYAVSDYEGRGIYKNHYFVLDAPLH